MWPFVTVMALTLLALAVATVMGVFGLLGSLGLFRYVHCPSCGRWMSAAARADSAQIRPCLQCRHHAHWHWPHFSLPGT